MSDPYNPVHKNQLWFRYRYIYIYTERERETNLKPQWPLVLQVGPPKQGRFQSKPGSFIWVRTHHVETCNFCGIWEVKTRKQLKPSVALAVSFTLWNWVSFCFFPWFFLPKTTMEWLNWSKMSCESFTSCFQSFFHMEHPLKTYLRSRVSCHPPRSRARSTNGMSVPLRECPRFPISPTYRSLRRQTLGVISRKYTGYVDFLFYLGRVRSNAQNCVRIRDLWFKWYKKWEERFGWITLVFSVVFWDEVRGCDLRKSRVSDCSWGLPPEERGAGLPLKDAKRDLVTTTQDYVHV